MTLVTVFGSLWGLTAPGHTQGLPLKIGTVLGVPLNDLERFQQANATTGVDSFGQAVPPNEVTLLHVSPVASAPFNTAIATVSVTSTGPNSGSKAWRVYFPNNGDGTISPLYQQINADDVFTNPRVIGDPSTGVVMMDVRQSDTGDFELDAMRFLLVRASDVPLLELENPAAQIVNVHLQQTAVSSQSASDETQLVQLVGIDAAHASELMIPDELASEILALNTNVTANGSAFQSDVTEDRVQLATVN
jgi:hypothetical protein